ncbi:YfiR family protein [Aquabacterium sp.]|uniref:YfiR family protein n=1 Tax=Aquabacterium sp. TaxID=1872578 RepID=UPI002CD90D76|nr:YfiR family protein [Aquabacterium sp.]HSW06794.1 YfiR family protein [Aquabacterium sp.]
METLNRQHRFTQRLTQRLLQRLRRLSCRAAAWPLVLGLLAWPAVAPVAAEPLEFAVKATYLTKFAFYVDWPGAAGPSPTITLCIVGDDPFGSLIDDAVAAHQGAGRTLVLRRLKTLARDAGCQIVYLGAEARAAAAAAADSLRGSPVLVVSDARHPGSPGIIHFVIQDNRVRFTIDDDAAAQNGLSISAKLLTLALSVKPRGGR